MPQTRNRLKPVQTGRFHLGWVFSPWRRGAFGTWASAPSPPAHWPVPATAAPSAYLLLARLPVNPTSSLHTSPPLRPPPLSSSDLPAEWGRGSGAGRKGARRGVEEEEVGRRAEPSWEESEDKTRGGLVRAACQSSAARPRLPVSLPLLPLPMLSPQARPFRPAHWLGAFGDGEGGAPLVSWWRREFERGARSVRSAFSGSAPDRPRLLPPTCGAWARRDQDPPPRKGAPLWEGRAHPVVFF